MSSCDKGFSIILFFWWGGGTTLKLCPLFVQLFSSVSLTKYFLYFPPLQQNFLKFPLF